MTRSDVKITDAFAVLALIGGVLSYSHNTYKELDLKRTEHADEVRAAAAQLLGKLNALHAEIPRAARDSKQRIVSMKVGLLTRYKPELVLHQFYGTILDEQSKALHGVDQLQVDPAYLAFYTFSPKTKVCIDSAIQAIEASLTEGYTGLLAAVEDSRLNKMPANKSLYSPAKLYNDLVAPITGMQDSVQVIYDSKIRPVEEYLLDVIGKENVDLLAETMRTQGSTCQK